jgi:hypothetical protein
MLQAENFTIGCAPPGGTGGTPSLTVQQGDTVSTTCYVVSLGGLTGPIQIACAEQDPPQIGPLGCTLNPAVVQGTGQTTLTVTTTAGNLAAQRPTSRPGRGPGPPSTLGPTAGGVALAFAGLLLWPIGRRARWLRSAGGRMLGLALLLAGLAAAGLGCNNAVVLNTNNSGTPLGVHTLKITAAADVSTVTVSHFTNLTVNVTP